jgi:hypothetical protein
MIPGVLYVQSLVDWESGTLLVRASALTAAIGVGMVSFGVVAMILGGEEVSAARRILAERVTRSRGGGDRG